MESLRPLWEKARLGWRDQDGALCQAGVRGSSGRGLVLVEPREPRPIYVTAVAGAPPAGNLRCPTTIRRKKRCSCTRMRSSTLSRSIWSRSRKYTDPEMAWPTLKPRESFVIVQHLDQPVARRCRRRGPSAADARAGSRRKTRRRVSDRWRRRVGDWWSRRSSLGALLVEGVESACRRSGGRVIHDDPDRRQSDDVVRRAGDGDACTLEFVGQRP